MIARRSSVRAFVLVQPAIEVEALQNKLDAGGDGRRVPTHIEARDGLGHAIKMAELMDVVEGRHHLGSLDGETVVERQDEPLEIADGEMTVEHRGNRALHELVDDLVLANLS
jgi:hypothetical protein